MPNLEFAIEQVRALGDAATPEIGMRLRIRNRPAEQPIHSVALQCQVDIDPARRRYQPEEQSRLSDLFGEPERWRTTLHRLHWTDLQISVPGFQDVTRVEVRIPCSFDFNLAVTRYFDGLETGEIPVTVMFRGMAFHAGEDGQLQVEPLPWDREAGTRLSVSVWRELLEMHQPGAGWVRLRRDTFDRLCNYRRAQGLADWEQTIEQLLLAAEPGGAEQAPEAARGRARLQLAAPAVKPLSTVKS